MCVLTRLLGLVVALSCGGTPAHEQPRRWEPVPAGMALTRNFMVPDSPETEGYRLFPQRYHLGTKAYGRILPDWWLRLVDEARAGDRWHPRDFPLAFAGEFDSAGGHVLLVVQVSHAFSGDGFLAPGPEVYLVARVFSIEDAGPKVAEERAYCLGSMQYARLLAGQANGRRIEFETEGGKDFDSRAVTWKQTWTLSLGDNNSLGIQKGELVFVDGK